MHSKIVTCGAETREEETTTFSKKLLHFLIHMIQMLINHIPDKYSVHLSLALLISVTGFSFTLASLVFNLLYLHHPQDYYFWRIKCFLAHIPDFFSSLLWSESCLESVFVKYSSAWGLWGQKGSDFSVKNVFQPVF